MQRMIMLTLLALTLVACGASPQAAAPTPSPVASRAAVATAAPAPTAAPTLTATPVGSSATPQETAVPDKIEPTASPTPPPPPQATRLIPTIARIAASPTVAPVVSEVPADLLAKILADAAQRSGVDAASIIVQKGEAVEWNDGSLGCPQPGFSYLQVITPGYQVLLEAGANTYDYRADTRGYFFVCQ